MKLNNLFRITCEEEEKRSVVIVLMGEAGESKDSS